MKVYVVMRDYDYEGYGEPEACFADEASADRFAASKPKPRDGSWDVFELEVQTPPIDNPSKSAP